MVVLVFYSLTLFLLRRVLFMTEPYPLGGVLIVVSIRVCYFISYCRRSVLAFLIFMRYVGGVIVLFLYVVRVHPNQLYHRKNWVVKFLSFSLSIYPLYTVWNTIRLIGESSIGSIRFINEGPWRDLYLLIGVILFVNLLIVCYLCMKKQSPLRSVS